MVLIHLFFHHWVYVHHGRVYICDFPTSHSRATMDRITLDVSGTLFTVDRSVLQSVPRSMIARMFSNENVAMLRRDPISGAIILATTPAIFTMVLHRLLRSSVSWSSVPFGISEEDWAAECDYLGLADEIAPPPTSLADRIRSDSPTPMTETELQATIVETRCSSIWERIRAEHPSYHDWITRTIGTLACNFVLYVPRSSSPHASQPSGMHEYSFMVRADGPTSNPIDVISWLYANRAAFCAYLKRVCGSGIGTPQSYLTCTGPGYSFGWPTLKYDYQRAADVGGEAVVHQKFCVICSWV